MGVIKRQGIKGTLVVYLGVLIGMFNTLWLFPYCLSPKEIGLIGVLRDCAALFTPFVLLGMPAVGIRFFPHFKNDEKQHNGILFFLIGVPLVAFVLFCGAFVLGADHIKAFFSKKSPLFNNYLWWVLPLTFATVYWTIAETYARSLHRIVVPNFMQDVVLRLCILAAVVLYFFKTLSLDGLVAAYAIAFVFCMLLSFAYIKWLGKLYLKPDFGKFSKPMLKNMSNFAFFVMLTGFGTAMVQKIDTLMIARYIDLDSSGIYRTAFFIGMVIEMPRRVISQIASPIIAEYFKTNEIGRLETLYKQVSINQFLVGCLLLIGIWVNVDGIFMLMPKGEIFSAGKYVVLFIGLGKLIDMLTSTNSEIIAYSKHYRYNIPIMLFLAIAVVVSNLLLIPRFGIEGAAMASALSLLLWNLIKGIFVYIKLGIHPFQKSTLWLVGIALLSLGFNELIPSLSPFWLDIMLRSALVGGLFLLLCWLMEVSKDLNQLTKQLLNFVKNP